MIALTYRQSVQFGHRGASRPSNVTDVRGCANERLESQRIQGRRFLGNSQGNVPFSFPLAQPREMNLPAESIDLEPLLSISDLARITGFALPTLYVMSRTGRLPRPLPLSKKRLRWRAADIRAWLNESKE